MPTTSDARSGPPGIQPGYVGSHHFPGIQQTGSGSNPNELKASSFAFLNFSKERSGLLSMVRYATAGNEKAFRTAGPG